MKQDIPTVCMSCHFHNAVCYQPIHFSQEFSIDIENREFLHKECQ